MTQGGIFSTVRSDQLRDRSLRQAVTFCMNKSLLMGMIGIFYCTIIAVLWFGLRYTKIQYQHFLQHHIPSAINFCDTFFFKMPDQKQGIKVTDADKVFTMLTYVHPNLSLLIIVYFNLGWQCWTLAIFNRALHSESILVSLCHVLIVYSCQRKINTMNLSNTSKSILLKYISV